VHTALALEELGPLVQLAQSKGILLSLETGYQLRELPRPAGMRILLDALAPRGLRAWLDTGHVAAQYALGFAGFEDWFSVVGDRWAGVHVHDCVGLRDHLVPGSGAIDFRSLLPQLPPKCHWTLEVDWYHSPEEVMSGVSHLRSLGF
jgi:sugar phosphate isomerase/epimerase